MYCGFFENIIVFIIGVNKNVSNARVDVISFVASFAFRGAYGDICIDSLYLSLFVNLNIILYFKNSGYIVLSGIVSVVVYSSYFANVVANVVTRDVEYVVYIYGFVNDIVFIVVIV